MFGKLFSQLRQHLRQESVREMLQNFNWMAADRLVRIFVGLLINAWIRRYLGPEQMGQWDYVLALANVFVVVSMLGTDRLLVRDIVKTPERAPVILGTGLGLRLGASLLSALLCVLVARWGNAGDWVLIQIAIITSLGIITQSSEVVTNFYQARMQSKYFVVPKNAALLLLSAVKVGMVYWHCPLLWFVWSTFVEMLLAAILLFYIYQRKEGDLGRWRFDGSLARQLLRESWPLLLSGLSYIIYVKTDQIMLGNMMPSKSAVAIFSTAVKIYEIPMAILGILGTVFFPKLTAAHAQSERDFLEHYRRMVTLMTLLAYVEMAGALLLGPWVIGLLFGPEYAESGSIFLVLMVGMVIMTNGGLRGSYLTITGKQRIILYNALIASVTNVLLNFLLIPRFGGIGAAWASVITQVVSVEVVSALFPELRTVMRLQLRALLLLDLWPALKALRKGGLNKV